MNSISEITKRDIFDLFEYGMDIPDLWEMQKVQYNYFGRLEEFEFCKRLYDLKEMPSLDKRYCNAEEDIWQHTVNNDDYPFCWVFEDERFQLKNGSDEIYLKFICEIFHPTVRNENGYWEKFLDEVNKFLKNDGYEVYPAGKISNRDVYSWRIYDLAENKLFIPFSQRNQKAIKEKRMPLSIKKNARNQIYQLFEKNNDVYRKTDKTTGWDYDVTTNEEVIADIRQFYIPKCFNEQGQYVETNNLKDFVFSSSPNCVIDAIEFFETYNKNTDFEAEVNAIFKLNEVPFKLSNGKVASTFNIQIKDSALVPIQEAGLKELLQEAANYYDKGNLNIAVEKLWDAFERLKTYYSPTLDKKKSVSKIIGDMSGQKAHYMDLFEKEFFELTQIGNSFRIRHHETTKINIEDDRHYDYFYKRCLSLISASVQYLA
ncbi:hypothetical protein QFZ77_006944 [Paenibacillus sp. V4I3]|uniref:AbiJ-related protein n=1 Tax=Paenibacillus sp. V4I3 TaxID=3042305 RepID=UPI00278952E2|nr:hypothetical protein [Paenibacillus sp. V4I3]MDQ0878285.1 hypothetical protein [Paenibacillus sp. V4I3]